MAKIVVNGTSYIFDDDVITITVKNETSTNIVDTPEPQNNGECSNLFSNIEFIIVAMIIGYLANRFLGVVEVLFRD